MLQNCEECRSQLSAYADGVMTMDETRTVHAHLIGCQPCAQELADLMAVMHALAALPAVPPREDPWAALCFRLRREGLIRNRLAPRARWVAAVAVGGGALALGWNMLFPPADTRMADLDSYWREHASFSIESEPVLLGSPTVHAIEANYLLQGDLP
jgi:anti-sigma factor RsiW